MRAPKLVQDGPYVSARCRVCGEKIKNTGTYWRGASEYEFWHQRCLRRTESGTWEEADVYYGGGLWNPVRFDESPVQNGRDEDASYLLNYYTVPDPAGDVEHAITSREGSGDAHETIAQVLAEHFSEKKSKEPTES